MKNNLGKLQIFSVPSDAVGEKKRIDVEYFQPYFEHIVKEVAGSKYKLQKLEDITALITNGRTPAKEMYDGENEEEGSTPIIKAATASGRFVDLEKLEYAKADFSGGKTAQKGDIFILSAAHQAKYVGKNVSLLDQEPPENTIFVGELICVRADTSKAIPEYLFGFLSSRVGYLLLNREKRGQTSHIYPEDIKNIPLPVPSLQDQEKIVAVLRKAYEEKRQKEEEIKAILAKIDGFVLGELGIATERERVSSVAPESYVIWSDVIERRLDPMYFHPARMRAIESIKKSNLPISPLSEVVSFRRELVGEIPENLPYVGLENIVSNSGEYVETGEKESVSSAFVFKKGDVLFPKLRPYLNKVFYADFDGVCSTEFHVLEAQKCSPFFLFAFLSRSVVVEQTSRLMTGNTLPRLQTDDVKELFVPIPKEEKQEKITSGVRSYYDKMRNLREEATKILSGAQAQVEQMILA
jgi:restriction endonuclease S subunit